MVEVFKTNVRHKKAAKEVLRALGQAFPHCKANFDLEDCDHVLRIECRGALSLEKLLDLMKELGVELEKLPD
jgi:predicted RNA binding protein with dsRBD fold (UPF0201 family)